MSEPITPFVGRRRELAELHRAIRRASGGEGSVVLLAGEPGIGKTRLAQQIAGEAAERGFRVLEAHCPDNEGTPPYWLWTQILRDTTDGLASLADLPTALVRSAGAPQGTAPSESASRPAGRFRDDPVTLRYQLFDAVRRRVVEEAGHQPVALVLDDLQWADRSSLALLELVAAEAPRSPLLILAAFRRAGLDEGHPLYATLGALARGSCLHLPLVGLGRPDADRLVNALLGRPGSQALLDAMYEHTEGNPFFLVETAKLLAWQDPDDAAAPLHIPATVRAALSRRLARLSAETRATLRIAAALGNEFDFALLASLLRLREEYLLAQLDEALEARVLRHVGEPERYALGHGLIRRALYEELSPSRRTRLHARIFRMLRHAHPEASGERAAALAHHAWRARSILDHTDVVVALTEAGEHALRVHAYDEACQHFRSGLEIYSGAPDGVFSARLHRGLGVALAATSERWNRQEAWEHLRLAAAFLADSGDAAGATATVVHPSLNAEAVRGMAQTLGALLERVRPDSLEYAHLMTRWAAASYFETGDYGTARSAFARAREIAGRRDDPHLTLRILAHEVSVAHFAVRWDDVLTAYSDLDDLAPGDEDLHAQAYIRYRAVFALGCMGRTAVAGLHAGELLSLTERLGDSGLLGDALYIRALLAHLGGRWDEEREAIDRGLARSPEHLALLHLRIVCAVETGAGYDTADMLAGLASASKRAGPYPLRGALTALAVAQAASLDGTAATVDLDAWVDGTAAVVPAARAMLHIARGLLASETDAARAREHLGRLERLRGVNVAPPLVTSRLLGRLAWIGGYAEVAGGHFEAALASCRSAGFRPELAWTAVDSVPVLLAHGGAAKRAEAAALLGEAEAIAVELGMPPLRRRIVALREGHGAELADDRPPLTARELEVLRLVATGRTNKEVASALGISHHTVEVHVANVRAKTGSANRTEAAAFARRHGLLDS